MKLDFSVLTQPMQKCGGQVGQMGQPQSMLVPASPELSPMNLNEGDALPGLNAGTGVCPPLSPTRPPVRETRKPNVYAVVPPVPRCPPENNQSVQNADWDSSDQSDQLANCYIHGAAATRRSRPDGSWVCGSCHPDPYRQAVEEARAGVPLPMPEGVRLLQWRHRQPPIPITTFAVVNEVHQFVRTTLRQLQAALDGKNWLAGNWTVRELCERLEQVGVKVEVTVRKGGIDATASVQPERC